MSTANAHDPTRTVSFHVVFDVCMFVCFYVARLETIQFPLLIPNHFLSFPAHYFSACMVTCETCPAESLLLEPLGC